MTTPQYLVAHLREALATDPRTAELGVQVAVHGDQVHLSGVVACEERRAELDDVIKEQLSSIEVHNEVRVADVREPAHTEELG